MAAHPFGPIETFLLRGYKKFANDCSVAKLEFHDSKRVLVPDFANDPIWVYSAADPQFKLEKTAIVNSSDYEMIWDPKYEDQDLLSRGLGYRITFTMPADKEFNIHAPMSWPQVEIDFLDSTGSRVVNNPKQYISEEKKRLLDSLWKNKTSILKLASKFKTLTVEQTLFQVKVVENKCREKVFPVLWESSPEMDLKLKPYSELFRVCTIDSKDQIHQEFVPTILQFVKHMSENHSRMSADEKLKCAGSFVHSGCFWSQLVLLNKNNRMSQKVNGQLTHLPKDLRAWAQGTTSYPAYFDCQFLKDILHDLRITKTGMLAQPDWKSIPKKVPIKILSLHEKLSHHIMEVIRDGVEGYTQQPRTFHTHNFVVRESNMGVYVQHPNSNNEPAKLVLSKSRNQAEPVETHVIAVVTHLDTIVVQKSSPNPSGTGYTTYVDLSIVKLGQEPTEQTIKGGADVNIKWFAGDSGLFVWNSKRTFGFYPYEGCSNTDEEGCYTGIPLKLGNLEFRQLDDWTVGATVAIKQQRLTKKYFLMVQLPDKLSPVQTVSSVPESNPESMVQSQTWRFCCLKYTASSQDLSVMSMNDFPMPTSMAWELWVPNKAVWVEGRNNQIFGCVNYPAHQQYFGCSYQSHMLVVVHAKNRFSLIKSKPPNAQGILSVETHIENLRDIIEGGLVHSAAKIAGTYKAPNGQRYMLLKRLRF